MIFFFEKRSERNQRMKQNEKPHLRENDEVVRSSPSVWRRKSETTENNGKSTKMRIQTWKENEIAKALEDEH